LDEENRLTLVDVDGVDATYAYDALGRRVSRTDPDLTVKFSYDGPDVVADDDSRAVVKYQNAPGIDNKLKQKSGSTSTYFLQDHLGSTVGLANSGGSVTDSNSYDSFGNPTNTSFPTRFQFTGREYDSFTGLQYNRARWYSPRIGRFISEDPIGLHGGDINLYGYVWNNSPNYYGPLGLDGWGNNVADWWDARIRVAQDSWGGGDFPIAWDPVFGTTHFWGGLSGAGDMFRVGSGLGYAIYAPDENIYGRLAFGAMDVGRGAALFTTLAGPIAEPAAIGREYCPTENVKIAPFGNRTGHPTGELPHYHRSVPDPSRPGDSLPGQGKKRHRPWDTKAKDTSFWDRL
jgi:RHS repeat-associated protein